MQNISGYNHDSCYKPNFGYEHDSCYKPNFSYKHKPSYKHNSGCIQSIKVCEPNLVCELGLFLPLTTRMPPMLYLKLKSSSCLPVRFIM